MTARMCTALVTASLLSVLSGGPAYAQLRPEVTRSRRKASPSRAAQIVVETSPNAEVYLDDEFVGRASPEGRLVIGNVRPGARALRVSLSGKQNLERKVTAAAGRSVTVRAPLADASGTTGAGARSGSSRTTGPEPETVRLNPKDGQKYAWIPPGTFMMGCSPGDGECFDDEKPAHRITISKGFWMGQTAVTVWAYPGNRESNAGRAKPPRKSTEQRMER